MCQCKKQSAVFYGKYKIPREAAAKGNRRRDGIML
jgi:hypothetical protein